MVPSTSTFLQPLREAIPGLRATFVERIAGVPVTPDRAETVTRLRPFHLQAAEDLGFQAEDLRYAQQTHGNGCTVVDRESPQVTPVVDGLLTGTPGLALAIHVADCAALYLADPRSGWLGLLHSGKKGTLGQILETAVFRLHEEVEADPSELLLAISPCIRPPHYEIDLPALIYRQARDLGLRHANIADSHRCTAADSVRYYSYRRDRGDTGRLLAILGRTND